MTEAPISLPFQPPRDGIAQRIRLAVHPMTVGYLPWVFFVVAAVSYYYVFLASSGRFTDLPTQLDYYDRMAEGFRAGHLYVRKAPAASLLASSNPFDNKYFPVWLWDASLFKSHYYMYWGPVPGLALLAFKVLTGSHETITDQWITTLLMLGRFYAATALILSLATRTRLRQPTWLVCLAVAVFGLANPWPFTVARPHIYEGSLTGSQCFLFWGLVAVFWAIERPRWRRPLFVLASVAWALAPGCRATAFVAVPVLMLVALTFAWSAEQSVERPWKSRFHDLVALTAPFGVACCAYGAYNYARFDSFTEFGVHYQVTLQPFYGKPDFVIPNVYSYLFEPVKWSCRFPFVQILGDRPAVSIVKLPMGYRTFERAGGILLTAWWCWLLVIGGWHAVRQMSSRTRSVTLASAPLLTRYEAWASLSAVGCALAMVPVLTLWESSMRYVGDAMGGLVLLATLAAFGLVQRARTSPRRALGVVLRTAVVVLGVETCVVGAFAAFTSYDDPLKVQNPVLYRKLDRALSLCDKPL
ncbi:MAG TPA: hypothetical protein VH062_36660 [Polyangiaceae bacterium]|jgi:hypothetical protein|nr:hypothetical protein [Polyangiaceae bacterium]